MISNADVNKAQTVENPDGIFRTTLSYGDESMLCHFKMTKGSRIPLHNHVAVQNGFVIRGKLKFHQGPGGQHLHRRGRLQLLLRIRGVPRLRGAGGHRGGGVLLAHAPGVRSGRELSPRWRWSGHAVQ